MIKSSFSETYKHLPDSIKALIKKIIQELNPEKIILFGSRARGDHRHNSDFDIAVKSDAIPSPVWVKLQLALEEEPITLYKVDLVDFNHLSKEYINNILSEGKLLYAR